MTMSSVDGTQNVFGVCPVTSVAYGILQIEGLVVVVIYNFGRNSLCMVLFVVAKCKFIPHAHN